MSVTNLTASGTAASHLNYIIKYDKIYILIVFMVLQGIQNALHTHCEGIKQAWFNWTYSRCV